MVAFDLFHNLAPDVNVEMDELIDETDDCEEEALNRLDAWSVFFVEAAFQPR